MPILRAVLPVVAALTLFAVLLRLGFWQLERAQFKEALEQRVVAGVGAPALPPGTLLMEAAGDTWQFRATVLSGHAQSARQYLLDNRTSAGRAGYHVLLAVATAGGDVLVNRGWVPVGSDRTRLPDIALASTDIEARGRLAPLPSSGLLLGSSGYERPGWPKVVQQVDLEQMSRQLELTLLPAIVLLDASHTACFECDWKEVTGLSASSHRGYAVQWFSLAAALTVIVLIVTRGGRRWRVR